MNIADAIQFAWWFDHPLNLAITIHLDKAGIVDRPQRFVGAYMKLAGDWLRLKGVEAYYVWVLENPPYGGRHLHVMIYWPKQLRQQLGPRLRRWLKLAGGTNRSKVLRHMNLPQREDRDATQYGPSYGRYLLKGADPKFWSQWREPRQSEFQGWIKGKRCGTSQSIGPAARRRVGQLFPYSIRSDWHVQKIPHHVLGLSM